MSARCSFSSGNSRTVCRFAPQRRLYHRGAETLIQWGPSIVGFGSYHYKYASGREGDWPIIGFSPRKREITLYIMPGFEPFADLMANLGTYRTGVSCLYVKQLADIDQKVLRQLLARTVMDMKARAPS